MYTSKQLNVIRREDLETQEIIESIWMELINEYQKPIFNWLYI